MNEQMNILLEVLEEIKQQNRELKASITNLVSQPNLATNSSGRPTRFIDLVGVGLSLVRLRALAGGEGVLPVAELPFRG